MTVTFNCAFIALAQRVPVCSGFRSVCLIATSTLVGPPGKMAMVKQSPSSSLGTGDPMIGSELVSDYRMGTNDTCCPLQYVPQVNPSL